MKMKTLYKNLKADILKFITEADATEANETDGWVLRIRIYDKLLGFYYKHEIDKVIMKHFYMKMMPGGIFYVKEDDGT